MRHKKYARSFAGALLSLACISTGASAKQALPALGIDIEKTSVSGLSSGAFMTTQFYVVNSDIMVGAGVVAGGPYLCAQSWDFQSYILNATTTCMNPLTSSSAPNTPALIKKTKALEKNKDIDSLSNLKNDRIYLFSGTKDQTVTTLVMNQTEKYFLGLGVPQKAIEYSSDVKAGHAMITDNPDDTKCSKTQPPYINDCDFDQAYSIMKHIYGDLKSPAEKASGDIIAFDQQEYIDAKYTSMSEEAYLYVPQACQTESCRLHVVFHGCRQGAKVIGNEYYETTGYNEIADTNKFVVLYPQVEPSNTKPLNPRGCWDFWGYSSPNDATPDYFTKKAPQLRAVRAMVNRLAEKPAIAASND